MSWVRKPVPSNLALGSLEEREASIDSRKDVYWFAMSLMIVKMITPEMTLGKMDTDLSMTFIMSWGGEEEEGESKRGRRGGQEVRR